MSLYFFSVLFDQKWTEHATPTYVSCGSVLILSAERSAIFSSPIFPRTYWHLTYLAMKDQITVFVFTIQYPDDLILFKV